MRSENLSCCNIVGSSLSALCNDVITSGNASVMRSHYALNLCPTKFTIVSHARAITRLTSTCFVTSFQPELTLILDQQWSLPAEYSCRSPSELDLQSQVHQFGDFPFSPPVHHPNFSSQASRPSQTFNFYSSGLRHLPSNIYISSFSSRIFLLVNRMAREATACYWIMGSLYVISIILFGISFHPKIRRSQNQGACWALSVALFLITLVATLIVCCCTNGCSCCAYRRKSKKSLGEEEDGLVASVSVLNRNHGHVTAGKEGGMLDGASDKSISPNPVIVIVPEY